MVKQAALHGLAHLLTLGKQVPPRTASTAASRAAVGGPPMIFWGRCAPCTRHGYCLWMRPAPASRVVAAGSDLGMRRCPANLCMLHQCSNTEQNKNHQPCAFIKKLSSSVTCTVCSAKLSFFLRQSSIKVWGPIPSAPGTLSP